MKYLILFLMFLFIGCAESPENKRSKAMNNRNALANPILIGETKEGFPVYQMVLKEWDTASAGYRLHYLYYIGNSVTENYLVSEGKTSKLMVTATIDGRQVQLLSTNVTKEVKLESE